MSLPDSFYRAESAYLDPPELSPAADEWHDAQAEKADLIIEAAESLNGGTPACYEVFTLDTLEDAIVTLEETLAIMKRCRDEYYELEHEFPADGADEW